MVLRAQATPGGQDEFERYTNNLDMLVMDSHTCVQEKI